MPNKKFVISLGGSLIYTKDEINVKFLKRFQKFIAGQIKKGRRFIIVVGGGKLARDFQNQAKKLIKAKDDDLDWLGIYSTHCNACLVKTILGDLCEKEIIIDPSKKIKWTKKIMVAAGWKPGWSTDYDAVYLADKFSIGAVINLSDIDYVYDKDPDKYKKAKPLSVLSWNQYLKKFNDKWTPGANAPFGVVGSRLAKKKGISAGILNGNDLVNVANFLDDKKFKGTMIK